MTALNPVPKIDIDLTSGKGQEKEYAARPHNEEAEQGLLGALLLENQAVEKINEFLKPEHFYHPTHGAIFQAILILCDRGQVADPVTLKAYFAKDDGLAHVGGAAYLAELAANVVSVANTYAYGQAIYDTFLRRQLINVGEDMAHSANNHDLDNSPMAQIETAEATLFKLAEHGDYKKGFVSFQDSLTETIKNAEKAFLSDSTVTGVTTGFRDLDKKLGGLHPSDLLILAARPSMGKTSLAINIGYKAAQAYVASGGKEGARVGIFSLEMSSEQLALRILSDASNIGSEKIRRGDITQDDFHRFAESSQKLSTLPLYIDDSAALNISGIRTRARRLQRQHGLDLIILDYLQLLGGTGKRASDNRVQEISEISRGLKTLAKELEVPVLALSQLSRQVENRENKRPQLSDLRESGSIEQDADVVMFIYREEYYLAREEPSQHANETPEKFGDRYARWQEQLARTTNVAEVIVSKQRHGPIGTVELFFEGEYTRFADLDRHHGE